MNRFNDRENGERFPQRNPEREKYRTEQGSHLGASRDWRDYDPREFEQPEQERFGQRGSEYHQERFGGRSQYGEQYGQRGMYGGQPSRERFSSGYGYQEPYRGRQGSWEGYQGRAEEPEFGTGYERRGEFGYPRQEYGYPQRQSSFGRQSFGSERGAEGPQESGWGGERGLWQGQSFASGQTQRGFESGATGRFAGRGPKGYRRSDERILEDINERLTQHPDIDATEIEVRVNNGEVTLSGSVEERQIKRLAEDIAESVAGVKDVQNQIRVSQGILGQMFGQQSESESSGTQRKSGQTTGKEK